MGKPFREQGKKDVLIYEDWHEYLKKLGPERYMEAMDAIFKYGLDGKFPETADMNILGLMIGIMPVIDSNNKRWLASKKSKEKMAAAREAKAYENIPTNN